VSTDTTNHLQTPPQAPTTESPEVQQLLADNLSQVDFIARAIHRHLPRHVLIEDLFNAGVIGLIDAIRKVDRGRKVPFNSYARFRIRGAILDSLRELDWGPRILRRRAREIAEMENRLSIRLERTPTQAEVAEELKMELTEFQAVTARIQGLAISSTSSANALGDGASDDCDHLPSSPDDTPFFACLRSEMRTLVQRILDDLPPQERRVISLYYFEELTMRQIGLRLGIGESRVSQIHGAALAHLRARVQAASEL
jgi:RNA polymerase sigma factor for flagellar operon FliA